MKNVFSLFVAGIFGGLVVLTGSYFTIHKHSEDKRTAFQKNNYALQTNMRMNTKPAYAEAAPFDFTQAAKKAMPVVVHIKASETPQANNRNKTADPFFDYFSMPFGIGPRQGTGSGVIISDDGYIVTNNHVVEFADEVQVTLYDNRQFKAKVIGTDANTDMAVIKIEANNLPTLPYADSDKAQVGEWVLAVGNPFNLTSTITAGIISAKGRDINIIQGDRSIESFIQTDAAVNPGNSGGALVNDKGELLGINTAIATQTGSFSGYSFAIPVNIMRKIVDDLIKYGSYQRAFLGINILELDSELAEELGISITKGVVIRDVIDGGAAQFAGMLPNDVITKVGDKKINSVPELQEVIGRSKVGERVDITVSRKGKLKVIPVVLKQG